MMKGAQEVIRANLLGVFVALLADLYPAQVRNVICVVYIYIYIYVDGERYV